MPGRNAGNPVYTCAGEDAQSLLSCGAPLTTRSKALQKCVYGDKYVTIFCNEITTYRRARLELRCEIVQVILME